MGMMLVGVRCEVKDMMVYAPVFIAVILSESGSMHDGPPGGGGKPPKMAILGVSPPPPHFGGFGPFWPKTPKNPDFVHLAAPRVNPTRSS